MSGVSTSTILIVDDSEAVRRANAFMLGSAYTCVQAEDGRQALAILGDSDVDLVIADLHMPVMDGLEMLREMRKSARTRFTPVLVLTTEGREDMIAELRKAGATGVLQKPTQADGLREAVRRALGPNAKQ